MSEDKLREEGFFTLLTHEGIPQLLAGTELWAFFDALPDSPEKDELRARLIAAVGQSLEEAQNNPLNQHGEISDIFGKYNIVLGRFCKGALLIGYSVLASVVKQKGGPAGEKPGLDEGEKLLAGVGDLWKSISTPDPDAMAIVEAVASWDFENSHRLLREPGPSAQEIADRLTRNGVEIDSLGTKLKEMVKDEQQILSESMGADGAPRYQVRYIRTWVEKILY